VKRLLTLNKQQEQLGYNAVADTTGLSSFV